MEVMGAFNQDMKTDETDLCVILTNAVANAYEATIKCKGEKILDIRITNYKDRQFIKIINSVAEDVVIKDSRMQREQQRRQGEPRFRHNEPYGGSRKERRSCSLGKS